MRRLLRASGLLLAALLPVFFLGGNTELEMAATLLMIWFTGSTLIAAFGNPSVYAAWLGPAIFVLVAGWLWHGGVMGYVIALLSGGTFAMCLRAVREQRRSWEQLFRLLDDNEQLAARLESERDRAEAASEARTRFFAAASHDLRQPLHALSVNATTLELVARRSTDPLLAEVSDGIGRALKQSRGLLDGLLDISRLDAGAVKVRLAAHDVGELLRVVHAEFAGIANQRGLTLELRLDEGPLWARTDATQLQRIVGNLVDNAVKFTREGTVTLAAQREGAHTLLVSVTDTGPGIAPLEREKVFEEFYQVGNPARDRTQGLGLGLAIVRRTARLLGAEIELRDAPPHGCRFELRLPSALPPSEASLVDAADDDAGAELEAIAPLSVLVVDDEAEVLRSLGTYLHQLGWSSQGVRSGADAEHALAAGGAFDVAVVDFRLGDGENGLDVIGRLRIRAPTLPAVIVTGDSAPQQLGELRASGIRVLHKPIDGAKLARALADAVASARAKSGAAKSVRATESPLGGLP